MTDCLTAVILDPETVGQCDSSGVPFPQMLEKQGIVPGVKPSLTVYKLPGTNSETYVRRAELPLMNRGDAVAATWIFRGDESPQL